MTTRLDEQDASLSTALIDAASQLSLPLTADQQAALLSYLGLLQRWNRTYNLTAIRDPSQMLVHHLVDSMAVVGPLNDVLKGKQQPIVVDVGSGAGLPGVVVAALCPGMTVHCVDAVEKKATFIRHVAGVLGLANLHSHHGRVEKLPPFEADIVVSRAFASLSDFVQLAGRHAAAHGRMLAMKGKEREDEIRELHERTSWRVEDVIRLNVPGLDARRCLLWLSDQGKI